MSNKYVNGLIYRIICNDTNEQYYGSTIQTLAQRLSGHVASYKKWSKDGGKKLSSCPIIERNNYKIILVEAFPCNNKMELERQERTHIEQNLCLNRIIPQRTTKEYYKDNVEKLKEYGLKYKQENKAIITEQKKAVIMCECGENYTVSHKSRHLKSHKAL
jgi:hypothetical protein